ncbi:hypothetical protein CGCF413_v004401 [Colletotrichum fructicola]|nr:hypothetical protein CGCF413_v004401 [Colletotrichum fructicola]
MAELDEELRLKLEGMSGEGGAAGVEYENGKAEGLKRGVKSNMFRPIRVGTALEANSCKADVSSRFQRLKQQDLQESH